MKDFTPTETVTCVDWTVQDIPALKANCTGKHPDGADWFAELVRCETDQEYFRINFHPVDPSDYPKMYAHLEQAITNECERQAHIDFVKQTKDQPWHLEFWFDSKIFTRDIEWAYGTESGFRGDAITDNISSAQRKVVEKLLAGGSVLLSVDPNGNIKVTINE